MAKDTAEGSAKKEDKPRWHNAAPDWYRDGAAHVWHPYTQMQTTAPPLPVVATEGVRIKLADGRELIDGIGSWWTACHGYNHPRIVAAMSEQLETMPHVMFGGLGHEPGYKLASRLAGLLPGDLDHVFFSDSGSVATEVALKMAGQYWINKGVEGRSGFVAFTNGYHGDTWGAMSVTDPGGGMQSVFEDRYDNRYLIDMPETMAGLGQVDAFLSEHSHKLAGMFIEPMVQGAGGMKFQTPEILAGLYELAQLHNVLFIADEIFTGFGRTGTMFACEQAGIVPDIICVGKAMTGGATSLAATIARGHVYEAFLSDDPSKALMHGPTYMANPVACAAANASLDLFEEEPWQKRVRAVEDHMAQALERCRSLTHVLDVRVKGAIGVVQLDELRDLDWLKVQFVESGVWLRPFSDIIYLTPSFNIDEVDLVYLTDAIVAVLTEWDTR